MLYNLGQIRTKIQQYLGFSVLDSSTTPTQDFVDDAINDSIREVLSAFNFRQLETAVQIPFYHSIPNVQGAYFSGISTFPVAGSGISGTVIPYPSNNLLINNAVIETYSGITFIGQDINGNSYTGTSVSGSGVIGSVNTIGYTYDLPADVDQIYGIIIPQNSIKLLYVPQYDLERFLPNNVLTASGTPAYYTEFNGLSSTNTKQIQFFPQPQNTQFSGQTFVCHYKKMHTDLEEDTDTQNVLPQQFQDIIIDSTLEKIYAFLSDEKTAYHKAKKEERMADLIVWANNHLDYTFVERDANFLGSAVGPFLNTPLFRI